MTSDKPDFVGQHNRDFVMCQEAGEVIVNEISSPSLSEWMTDRWNSSITCPETLPIDTYLQKCLKARDLLKKDDSKNYKLQEASLVTKGNHEVEADDEKSCDPDIRALPICVGAIVEKKSKEYVVKGDGPCLLRATAAHIAGNEEEGPNLARDLNTHQSEYRDYYEQKVSADFPLTITVGVQGEKKEFENSREYFDWLQESNKAAYMWRGCVDIIAIANMVHIEIDVVLYEKEKVLEIVSFKPDQEFPWKEEDPMKPVSLDHIRQGKMVLLNWKNQHFNLIIGPNHMLSKYGCFSFQAARKSGKVSKSLTIQPNVSKAVHSLKLKEIAPVRKVCSEVESVPTKIGSGPRKGHSKPSQINCAPKSYDPSFLLCNQWSSKPNASPPCVVCRNGFCTAVNETTAIPNKRKTRKQRKSDDRKKIKVTSMSKEDILLDYEQLERNQLISKGLSGKRLYQVSTGLIQVLTHDGKAYKFVQYNERMLKKSIKYKKAEYLENIKIPVTKSSCVSLFELPVQENKGTKKNKDNFIQKPFVNSTELREMISKKIRQLELEILMNQYLKYLQVWSNLILITSSTFSKGLRGGGGGNGPILQGLQGLNMELQLENLNNCNACYVNSAIQVFFMTGYAQFILNKKTFIQHQRVSKALFDIFSGKETSVKKLRQIISIDSGKFYYDNNSQQDSAEFLGDLEDLLSKELESEDFREVQNCHWGSENLTRKFF